jgi:hypothetical protein
MSPPVVSGLGVVAAHPVERGAAAVVDVLPPCIEVGRGSGLCRGLGRGLGRTRLVEPAAQLERPRVGEGSRRGAFPPAPRDSAKEREPDADPGE